MYKIERALLFERERNFVLSQKKDFSESPKMTKKETFCSFYGEMMNNTKNFTLIYYITVLHTMILLPYLVINLLYKLEKHILLDLM